MRRLATIALAAIFLSGCAAKDPRALGYGDLPGPAINMLRVVHDGSGGQERSRGVVDIELSQSKPATTFWNDPDTKTKPWGTVTLQRILADGTVIIHLDAQELKAKPGKVFPGTGMVVIESDAARQQALLRSKWTMTVIHDK